MGLELFFYLIQCYSWFGGPTPYTGLLTKWLNYNTNYNMSVAMDSIYFCLLFITSLSFFDQTDVCGKVNGFHQQWQRLRHRFYLDSTIGGGDVFMLPKYWFRQYRHNNCFALFKNNIALRDTNLKALEVHTCSVLLQCFKSWV